MKLFISIFIALLGITSHADPKAIHGMVVFGDQDTYVSHLPMFHSPHDYQYVAQVNMLSVPSSETMSYYLEAKAEGHSLFTLAPKPFDLSQLVAGQISTFEGTLYQGHFEKGGKALGPVEISIEKVILAEKLEGFDNKNAYLDYTVFGQGGEYYVVHNISEKPSFDYIAKVSHPYRVIQTRVGSREYYLPDFQLPTVIQNPISHKWVGDHFEPPAPGEFQLPAEGEVLSGGFISFDTSTTILNVIYSNTDELAH